MPIRAVIFDMDGVLIDSEPVWNRSRVEMAAAYGRTWTEEMQRACMGRATVEWAEEMRQRLPLEMPAAEVMDEIGRRMQAAYDHHLPVLPGAVEAVHRMVKAFAIAVASGSMTVLIEHVLAATGLERVIPVVVLGDSIPRGKPAPDIYLEAARRLGFSPGECVGVEDSGNGLRSLKAAGMKAIAVPAPSYPLATEVLRLADLRLASLEELTVEAVRGLG
ncbi:MAG TPA: HAD family phosphatase [Anaeromyxobacter sp.]|nr:HAD family phosphatase [Anaeromyxobacter sp.]